MKNFLTSLTARVGLLLLATSLLLPAIAPAFGGDDNPFGAPKPPYFYKVDRLYTYTGTLGLKGKLAHVGGRASLQLLSASLAYTAANHWSAFFGVLAYEAVKFAPAIRTQTYVDLDLRFRLDVAEAARALSLPGNQKLHLITTNTFKTAYGVLVVEMNSEGFIIVESDKPISPEEWAAEKGPELLGNITLVNSKHTQVQADFLGQTGEVLSTWRVSLDDVLNNVPVNEAQVDQWKELYHSESKKPPGQMKVQASLIFADGTVEQLGPLASGKNIHKFLGLGIVKKWVKKAGFKKDFTLPIRTIDETEFWTKACGKILSIRDELRARKKDFDDAMFYSWMSKL